MERLSERWFKLIKDINGIIFLFIFFWSTLYFWYHIGKKMYNHQLELFLLSCVAGFMWFIAPFSIAVMIIRSDKVEK